MKEFHGYIFIHRRNIVLMFMVVLFSIHQVNSHSGTSFFSTLSMRDGLPSNIISSITQDKYGFIWIGTGNGLARYDGYQIKIFQRSKLQNSLSSNEINSICAHEDFVWIGTWEGLCKIDIKSFKVTRIDLGEKNPVRTLYIGKNNILWVGTAGGLIKYRIENDQFETFTAVKNNLSHNMVRAIYEDSRQNIWVGTYDKLNVLSVNDTLFIPIDLKGDQFTNFTNHLILDIKPVSSNADSLLWIGTELGLYKINAQSKKFTRYEDTQNKLSNEVIKCIYTSQDNNIWLGTDFGLNIFNPYTKKNEVYFHNPRLSYSIANNVIWQIFEDAGGVIWLVTSNGLSRINKFGNFYTYHEITTEEEGQLIGNQVRSILVGSNGVYWLASQHGVIRIDPKSGTNHIFDTDMPPGQRIIINNVFALEEDRFGHIWIGTAGGINIWDEANHTMHKITADSINGLKSNYIGKFSKSPDGTIWVSAWEGGVYRIDGDLRNLRKIRFTPIPTFEMGSEKHVYGDGNLWIIEYDELYRIDPEKLTNINIPTFVKTVEQRMIYSMYFSKNNELWGGSANGLFQYIPLSDEIYFHPINTGREDIITSILEDEQGNIWCTTNTSLIKFYPDTNTSEHFPLDNNLPLKSFFYGCTSKNSNGELIFGGDNGFISLLPERAIPNMYRPPVYITNLEINNTQILIGENINGIILNNDIAFTNDLKLKYAQRSISFEFSSLHFWQPATNVYTYKLEGFDLEWNFASGLKNFAVYSNLPPGEYSFMVKGTNNYGIESDQVAHINFSVSPPILLSKGFILLYIIIMLIAIYYSLKFYTSRVQLKNQLMIAKLEKEHAEEIEHTKEQFFTNISHELRTPISLILPPIHEIQQKGKLDSQSRTLIGLAEKNSVRLLRLVNQILDFNKIENDTLHIKVASTEMVSFCQDVFSLFEDTARRHKIEFNFKSAKKEYYVWIDTEKMETVLFNLLSNAFKYTPDQGKIQLSLDIDTNDKTFKEGAFEIKVRDTGIGISKEDKPKIFDRFYQSQNARNRDAGSGLGLTLAAEYVNLHHGAIEVDSQIEKGTTFIVKLPLGNKHFPLDSIQNNDKINLLATRSVHEASQGHKQFLFNLKSDKPLILIIDDNIDMIEFIRSSLNHKYNIVTAENGEEGLIKASNWHPEVIISDIMMPVLDGLALCKNIKENPRTSHVGIILLTAKNQDSQKIEGIRSGADVYLTKPFEMDLLEAHIDNLILRKKELTEYFRGELMMQPQKPDMKNNVDKKFTKRVMDIIEANVGNPELTVEMISGEMAMSSTHLYRKLKALTDHSAKMIIQKYRLKKASLMLKNKEGNISEIMYQVGFTNLSYFSKCFKSEFGMTPKLYQDINAKDKKLTIG